MRWLFADQLGPHFLGPDENPGDDGVARVLLIESSRVFRRRRYHRAKAHLILSALRHRAAELGDRAMLVQGEGYVDAVRSVAEPVSVIDPTSWPARSLVRALGAEILPSRGFISSAAEFSDFARGRKRLVLEDFYRASRRRTGVLMEGGEPVDGRWNFDAENRLPPPKKAASLGLPRPWTPVEDEIDEWVRGDLDRLQANGVEFIGDDGPRAFAATRDEALAALRDFIDHRLASFGPYEDAALADDWVMAHSLLSVPLNLGLLHPMEVILAVERAWEEGRVPLQSAEGIVRQILGWRDFVWHLYWYFGPDYAQGNNALGADAALPEWWTELRDGEVTAKCLGQTIGDIRRRGWVHHIPRLMILGNWALQRGYDPAEVNEWFTRSFVDGFAWVMPANVIGMALYADGGRMATKPYAAGGAYIKRMTNYCQDCAYRPDRRLGEDACPFTAGYWWFLERNRERLKGNPRMSQPLAGLNRLADLTSVCRQEESRGDHAP